VQKGHRKVAFRFLGKTPATYGSDQGSQAFTAQDDGRFPYSTVHEPMS